MWYGEERGGGYVGKMSEEKRGGVKRGDEVGEVGVEGDE